MGHGFPPGPAIDVDDSIAIDPGTSVRSESPTPGPVGLDAKGGDGAKGGGASIGDQVVGYAVRQRGRRVGDGECFTLADRALHDAGAKSAADFGTVTPTADYVWGSPVALSDLRAGDVIQFRDYSYVREVVTEGDSETRTETEEGERPHHTAIVERVNGGTITVLEQNAPDGSAVTRHTLYLSGGTSRSGGRTTTITVHGTFWFYRPQAQ